MLADHCGDIAAGRGQMRGVGAEIDSGQREDYVDLRGALYDRRQMRMIVRAKPPGGGDCDDLFEALGEQSVIVGSKAVEALGAAPDDQMFGPQFRSRIRGPRDARAPDQGFP